MQSKRKLSKITNILLKKKIIVIIFLYSITSIAYGESVIEQTALASPQHEDEVGNTELLKKRAIENALELALIKFNGATISTDKRNDRFSIDKLTVENGVSSEKYLQQQQSDLSIHMQTTGKARLIEITEEKYVGDDYLIRAKIGIGEDEDNESINAGYFWDRAGKPKINLVITENNTSETDSLINSTVSYVNNNYSQNGIKLRINANDNENLYTIKVHQELNTTKISDFDALSTHCNIVFSVIDNSKNENAFIIRQNHGPKAGFSVLQSQRDCLKEIMPKVVKESIEKLSETLDKSWRNGSQYLISISNVNGINVDKILQNIRNTHLVVEYRDSEYVEQTLSMNLLFKGSAEQLISTLNKRFEISDCPLKVIKMSSNEIYFNCNI